MDTINKINNKTEKQPSKVLKNIEKQREVRKLKKLYDQHFEEYFKLVSLHRQHLVREDRGDNTNKDIREFVKNYNPEGEREDSAWESGFLKGVNYVIKELQRTEKVFESKEIYTKVTDEININSIDRFMRESAEKYAEKFINDELSDVETIYNFLSYINKNNFYGEGNEVALIWNKEENNTFDVFYNHKIKDREYYVSVEYIEYLNEIENKEVVTDELVNIAYRVSEHIDFLDKSNKGFDELGITLGDMSDILEDLKNDGFDDNLDVKLHNIIERLEN